MGKDATDWISLGIGVAGLVLTAFTLWFVVTDRVRQARRIDVAVLEAESTATMTRDDTGERFHIVEISNTGGATARICMVVIVGIDKLPLLPQGTGEKYLPRFTLPPGEGFSLAFPDTAPNDTWMYFFFEDRSDRRLFVHSWYPAFNEWGPDFKRPVTDRLFRRFIPRRFRRAYPVGPGGAAIQTVPGRIHSKRVQTLMSLIPHEAPQVTLAGQRIPESPSAPSTTSASDPQ